MAITIRDIAAAMELSPSTVSRSLHQSHTVHPLTRLRVAEVAGRLGYQGKSRRTQTKSEQTATVALLLRSEDSHTSPNAMRSLQGLSIAAQDMNLRLTVQCALTHDSDVEDVNSPPPVARNHECDVLVLEGWHEPAMVAKIAEHVPVVALSHLYPGVRHDAVLHDNTQGIAQVVGLLADRGHRQLGWVGELRSATWSDEREAGFLLGCRSRQLPLAIERMLGAAAWERDGRIRDAAVLELLDAGVTGIVCVNDRVAGEILRVLDAHRIKVPRDVSVTGFDAAPSETAGQRVITSIDPRFVEMGRVAIDLAQRRISQPAACILRAVVEGSPIHGTTIGPRSAKSRG